MLINQNESLHPATCARCEQPSCAKMCKGVQVGFCDVALALGCPSITACGAMAGEHGSRQKEKKQEPAAWSRSVNAQKVHKAKGY